MKLVLPSINHYSIFNHTKYHTGTLDILCASIWIITVSHLRCLHIPSVNTSNSVLWSYMGMSHTEQQNIHRLITTTQKVDNQVKTYYNFTLTMLVIQGYIHPEGDKYISLCNQTSHKIHKGGYNLVLQA